MDNVIFRERLRPGPVNLVLGALGGLAIGAVVWPVHATGGYVTGAVGAVVVVVLLVVTSPLVVVDLGDRELGDSARCYAGRARIGVEDLGAAEVLDTDALREAMGPGADVRAYVCHRFWVHQGVRAAVIDPRDPTPYWLIASRRPAALAAALERAQAAHSEQTS